MLAYKQLCAACSLGSRLSDAFPEDAYGENLPLIRIVLFTLFQSQKLSRGDMRSYQEPILILFSLPFFLNNAHHHV